MNSWKRTSITWPAGTRGRSLDGSPQHLPRCDPPSSGRPREIDPRARHAQAVGRHRAHRGRHAHGIAVRLHDPRVGKDAQQRADLLEVLRRLEQPAARPAQPLERLEQRGAGTRRRRSGRSRGTSRDSSGRCSWPRTAWSRRRAASSWISSCRASGSISCISGNSGIAQWTSASACAQRRMRGSGCGGRRGSGASGIGSSDSQ